MSHHPTEESFLKDVSDHEMLILHDDGIYRHVMFKKPGTMCMHFELVTWPGYLAYSGDMGNYVFWRLEDMFQFFRADQEYGRSKGRNLSINLGYWSEKLVAVDGSRKNGCAEEFSEERFRDVVIEQRLEWIKDHRGSLSKGQRRELWDVIDSDVLSHSDQGEHAACNAAYEFSERIGGHRFEFTDFWDHRLTDYTYRFVWCCYALAYGVQQYDKAKVTS